MIRNRELLDRTLPSRTKVLAVILALTAITASLPTEAQPPGFLNHFRDLGELYNPDTGRVWRAKDAVRQAWKANDDVPDTWLVVEAFDPVTDEIDVDRSGLHFIDGADASGDIGECMPCGTDMRIWTGDLRGENGEVLPGGDGYRELYITYTDSWGVEHNAEHAYTSSRPDAGVEPPPPEPLTYPCSVANSINQMTKPGNWSASDGFFETQTICQGIVDVETAPPICLEVMEDRDGAPTQEIACYPYAHGLTAFHTNFCGRTWSHPLPPHTVSSWYRVRPKVSGNVGPWLTFISGACAP